MLNYPQVALEFMNRDHQEFVALREKLLALLQASPLDTARIDALLYELMDHTDHHFDEEEGRMLAAQFPPFSVHKGEHIRALAEIRGQVSAWEASRDAAALQQWLEQRLADWFVNHVNTMDFVTAAFIASRN
jgi:hemerythrin